MFTVFVLPSSNETICACQLGNSFFAVEETAQTKCKQIGKGRKKTTKQNQSNRNNENLQCVTLGLFPKCQRYFIIISGFYNRETTTTTNQIIFKI